MQINHTFYQHLTEQWQRFADTGEIPSGVRPEIAESWRRSRAYGVDMEWPVISTLSGEPLFNRLCNAGDETNPRSGQRHQKPDFPSHAGGVHAGLLRRRILS